MRRATYVSAFVLAFVGGCADKSPNPDAPPSSTAPESSATALPSDQSGATSMPEGVSYTIIDQNVVPGIKRSVDVRLNRKVTEDALTAIAWKLKNGVVPKSVES